MKKKKVSPKGAVKSTINTEVGAQSLVPDKASGHKLHMAMFHGQAIDRLMQISTRKTPPVMNPVTGVAQIVRDDMVIFIKKPETFAGLRVSTLKLLDIFVGALTKQNQHRGKQKPKRHVLISSERCMKLCGIPMTKSSKDKARCRLNEDTETLLRISIEFTEYSKGEIRAFKEMNIFATREMRHGNILMSFTPEAAQYLINSHLMLFPLNLFKLDERNPHAYYAGRKLILHNSILKNQERGTSNIISVDSFLKSMPHIPPHEEVMRTDREVERRIIKPFEKALDTLSGIILQGWVYCKGKGIPLTEEEVKNLNHSVFIGCYVQFELLNAPDYTYRLRAKAERRQKKSGN